MLLELLSQRPAADGRPARRRFPRLAGRDRAWSSARCSTAGAARRCASPLSAGVITGLLFWRMTSLSLSVYEKGTRLPDITLRNANGDVVQLADYQGGPLVINLWATWCPPCRREMPVLESAHASAPT